VSHSNMQRKSQVRSLLSSQMQDIYPTLSSQKHFYKRYEGFWCRFRDDYNA